LASASNVFGRGFSEKKIELILEGVPDLLITNDTTMVKVEKVTAIKGMAVKSAEAFVSKIEDFVSFLKSCGLEKKLEFKLKETVVANACINSSHVLFGKTVVMTGFRDKELQDFLKKVGATLGSSVSKNTFVVIVKDSDAETTGKVLDAKKLGINIISYDEFKKIYY